MFKNLSTWCPKKGCLEKWPYLPSNSFKQQQHMEQVFLSIQVMKRLQNIKGMHIVISEIYPSFQGDFQLLASFSQSFLLKF